MKNKKAISFLFAANIVSGFAQGITIIAIPWYFITILEKASLFGLIYSTITFVSLFTMMYTGTLIDKYNRRNIMLVITIAGGIILLLSALSGYVFGTIHHSLAGLVFAATFLIFTVHYPNMYAFIQEITEQRNYGKITSYIEIQGQMTNMLSGAAATILLVGGIGNQVSFLGYDIELPFEIKKWELHEIFLLDAITYFLAIILIVFIRFQPIAKREPEPGNVLHRLKSGLKYLKNNSLIFIFGIASYAVFITILVEGFLLIPVYVNDHLKAGAVVYAASEMFFAFGAVFAGLSIRWIFNKTPTVMAIIMLAMLTASVYYFFIGNTVISLFYLASLVLGLCNAGVRILRITYIFNYIPNQLIGRVGSVFNVINVMSRLLFLLLFSLPFFLTQGNVVYAYLILGTFVLLATLPLVYKYRDLMK